MTAIKTCKHRLEGYFRKKTGQWNINLKDFSPNEIEDSIEHEIGSDPRTIKRIKEGLIKFGYIDG